MECPSCMEEFQESEKIPLNLECGHSYCKPCMERMLNEFNFRKCPECRQPITHKLEDLVPNFAIIEIVQKKKEIPEYQKECEIHQGYFLDFQCKNCGVSLCRFCLTKHSGHLVVPIDYSSEFMETKVEELKRKIQDLVLEVDIRINFNSRKLSRVINHKILKQK